ncbi:VOC family protein [soil metagenome]
MKRVTGIGGIFFKSQDPEKTNEWYRQHLGLDTNQWGTTFEWRLAGEPEKKGTTQWSAFKADTKYFAPSTKEFMINYRVENLEWLVGELRKEGVTIIDEIASYDYGKFVHILDPDGNAIELWEPVDEAFDQIPDGKIS